MQRAKGRVGMQGQHRLIYTTFKTMSEASGAGPDEGPKFESV